MMTSDATSLMPLVGVLLHLTGSAVSEVCRSGYNYPPSCPQTYDPPHYTRCCRQGYLPSCCEERSNHVCALTRTGRYSANNVDPSPDHYAIFCPGVGQPDDYTACCSRNRDYHCCSVTLLGAIMGGVFGSLLLVGIIICIVCCVKIKRGDWICVKVGPTKYTVMSREKLARLQQLNAVMMQQRAAAGGAAAVTGPSDGDQPPAYNSLQPQGVAGGGVQTGAYSQTQGEAGGGVQAVAYSHKQGEQGGQDNTGYWDPNQTSTNYKKY